MVGVAAVLSCILPVNISPSTNHSDSGSSSRKYLNVNEFINYCFLLRIRGVGPGEKLY